MLSEASFYHLLRISALFNNVLITPSKRLLFDIEKYNCSFLFSTIFSLLFSWTFHLLSPSTVSSNYLFWNWIFSGESTISIWWEGDTSFSLIDPITNDCVAVVVFKNAIVKLQSQISRKCFRGFRITPTHQLRRIIFLK